MMKYVISFSAPSARPVKFRRIRGGGLLLLFLLVVVVILDTATFLTPPLDVPLCIRHPPLQLLLTITSVEEVTTQLPRGMLGPLSWLRLRLHHRFLTREVQQLLQWLVASLWRTLSVSGAATPGIWCVIALFLPLCLGKAVVEAAEVEDEDVEAVEVAAMLFLHLLILMEVFKVL